MAELEYEMVPVDFDPLSGGGDETSISGSYDFIPVDFDPLSEDDEPDSALEFGVDQAQRMTGRGVQVVEDYLGTGTNYGRGIIEQQDADIKAGGYTSKYNGSLLDQDGIGNMAGWLWEKTQENAALSAPALVGAGTAAVTATVSIPAALAISGGSFALRGVMSTGEVAQELDEKGIENAEGVALVGGAVIALLDTVGAGIVIPKSAISKLVGIGIKKEAAEELVEEVVKKGVTRDIAERVFSEAATETAQEFVNVLAAASQGAEYTGDELLNRGVDAAALGGTMGAGFAAPTVAMERMSQDAPETGGGIHDTVRVENADAAQAFAEEVLGDDEEQSGPPVQDTPIVDDLPPLSDADRASPIPDDLIQEGKAAIRDAVEGRPAPSNISVTPEELATAVEPIESSIHAPEIAVEPEIGAPLDISAQDDVLQGVTAQPEPDPIVSPVIPDAPRFDPLPFVGKMQTYISKTKKSLTPAAVGKHLGLTPEQATQVLGVIASVQDSPLRTTTKGNLARRAVRKGPVDVITFLADRGGVRDNEGHDLKKGRGLQRLVPGAGPLIRNDGLSLDEAGEMLHQHGYVAGERPTTSQVLDLVERAHSTKTYKAEEHVDAAEASAFERAQDEYQNQFESTGEATAFESAVEEQRSLSEAMEKAYNDLEALVSERLEPSEIYVQEGASVTFEDLERIDAEIEASEQAERRANDAERGSVGGQSETAAGAAAQGPPAGADGSQGPGNADTSEIDTTPAPAGVSDSDFQLTSPEPTTKPEDDSQSDMFGTTDADERASDVQKNRKAVQEAQQFGNQAKGAGVEQQSADSDGGLFEDAKKRDQGALDVDQKAEPERKPDGDDFQSKLRQTKYTSKPAVEAEDGHSYRIKKDGDSWIALQMGRGGTSGELPKHMRAPKGEVWTQDQAMERVQQEIDANQRATKPVDDQKTENVKDKIEDFGEKIGGARKDVSTKTGGKPKRAKDTRPAWQRRYVVSQIATEVSYGRETGNAGKYVITDTKTGRHAVRKYFDTEQEAQEALPLAAVSKKHIVRPYQDGEQEKYQIIRNVTDRKRVTIKDGFESRDEAMKYMATHAGEILETKTRIDDSIHPALEQAIREGDERRDGGRNAGAEDFKEVFGFRGVEFGNWNNQAERRHIMNQAYDALLDMAEMLGVPPKAISLNGELGLAFGARGHGLTGAKAHYELDYGVINLTKIKGAGSLAHEWLHAFDHYLARQAGKAGEERVENKHGDKVFKAGKRRDGDFVSYGFGYKAEERTRAELKEAFDHVMDVITSRQMEYTEDTSQRERIESRKKRALFDQADRYREDFTRELTWGAKKYRKPASVEQLKRVDVLLDRIRETDVGESVYVAPASKARGAMGYNFPEVLVELSKLHKEIRGKQGYGRQQGRLHGPIVDLHFAVQAQKSAETFLAEAKEEKVKSKKVRSEYYSEAWKMDQGATVDYWSTPHEMAARAFGGYIYDKLKGIEARNDFLSYEQHNNLLEYKLFNVKPFPEGVERDAINEAFDKLFDTIESRETDKGTELYRVDGGERLSLSDSDRRKVVGQIKTIVKQIAPQADVEVAERILMKDGGEAAGAYRPAENLIRVALSYGDTEMTVRHEAIHALKEMGLFSKTEWNLLSDRSRRVWMKRHDVNTHYKGKTREAKIEEGVAQGFAEHGQGGKNPSGIRRIFDKVGRFFERLANALRGMGFQTVEDVFEKVESGEVGQRTGENGGTAEEKYAAAHPMKEATAVDADAFGGWSSTSQLRLKVKQWARSNLAGNVYHNEATETDITVSWNGLKKALGHSHKDIDVLAFSVLPELIRKAIPARAPESDRKGRHNIQEVIRLQSRITHEGTPHDVVIVARKADDGTYYYDQFVIRKKEKGADSDLGPSIHLGGEWVPPISAPDESIAETGEKSHTDEKSGSEDGAVSDSEEKYSLVSMRRARAEVFETSDRVHGTPAQEAAIKDVMAVEEDRPLQERARDAVAGAKDYLETAAVQHTLDQFESIKRYEKAVKGKIQAASASAYKMARLSQNLHSAMASVLRHGPLAYEKGGFTVADGFKGGFEGIFGDLAERGLLHLWKGWAMANRAKRLMAEGRENNMTDAQIRELLALEKQYPEFRKVMSRWQAFNKAMLDMGEQAGVVNAEQRILWEQDDYVPFFRILDENGAQGPGNKRGLANQRSGIKTLKGGEEKVGDIIENMVLNMTHLVDASFKNIAAQRVVDMLEEGGLADGSVIEKAEMDWTTAHIAPAEAAKELQALGIDVGKLGKDQRESWLKLFTMRPPKDADVISVMVDGKPQYYRVYDPLLMASLTSMRPEGQNLIMDAMRAPKRWLTVSITSFPGFMLANYIRDSLHSWVVTAKNFKPFIDSADGLKKSWREDASLVGIMASGGGSGGYYRTAPNDVRKLMDAKLKGVSKGWLLDSPKELWEAWRKIGQASENANRIAVYDAVLKETGDKAEAAFQAMDLMDFSMQGDGRLVRFLIETVPFLNARAQGLYKMGRGAKENPKTFMMRGGMIMAASLGLMAINWDDERYDDIEEWEKDIYYHIFLDNIFPKEALKQAGIDPDQWHLKLPKPFEVGAVFSTLPERFVRGLAGKDDTKVTAERIVAMFRDTFAIGTPQFMTPILEQMANKVFFVNRPIVSMRHERLRPGEQKDQNTSELAKLLGEAFPDTVSPKRVDAIVRGYLGSLGTHVLRGTDVLLRPGDAPVEPEMRLDRIPELGRFFRSHPYRSTKWVTEFYEMRRETMTLVNSIKHMRKNGDIDGARELLKESKPKVLAHKVLRNVGKLLSAINKRIEHIERSDVTPARKRREIDKMYEKRAVLAKRAVKAVKTLEDKAR